MLSQAVNSTQRTLYTFKLVKGGALMCLTGPVGPTMQRIFFYLIHRANHHSQTYHPQHLVHSGIVQITGLCKFWMVMLLYDHAMDCHQGL